MKLSSGSSPRYLRVLRFKTFPFRRGALRLWQCEPVPKRPRHGRPLTCTVTPLELDSILLLFRFNPATCRCYERRSSPWENSVSASQVASSAYYNPVKARVASDDPEVPDSEVPSQLKIFSLMRPTWAQSIVLYLPIVLAGPNAVCRVHS